MNYADFMKVVRKHNNATISEDSKAAILRRRILHESHSNEEWLAIQEELKSFIASNPSREELNQLQGCGESLAMICSAINEGRL